MVKTQIFECANKNILTHSDQLKNVLKTKFRGQNKNITYMCDLSRADKALHYISY